ncbi:MAG: T9SS type A sorting domain-containing protein [Flavobacteriales bacterium]
MQDVVVSHNMYVGNLTVTSNNSIHVTNGATLTIDGNLKFYDGAVINVDAGSTLIVKGKFHGAYNHTAIINGTLEVTGHYKVTNGLFTHNINGNVSVGGDFQVNQGIVGVSGALDITGKLKLSSSGIMQGFSGHVTYGSYSINGQGFSYLICGGNQYTSASWNHYNQPPANGMDFSTCGAYTPTVCDSDANNTTSTDPIRETQTKSLVGTPSGGSWSIVSGGGSISSSTYSSANITANKSIKIRYTIAADGSCPATTSDRTFTVTPVADNTTTNATITELQTKTLIATPAGGTWSIVSGGGSISGSTYTPANINTNTNVKIRYTFAGTISERTFLVTPICTAADNATTTASITENQTKTLTGNPPGGSWSIVSGGGSITGSTYTPANINTNTTVKIRYTIAADGSCDATTSVRTFTVTPVVIFWNGNEDNEWSNVNNWSTNYLPANNNAVVVIPGGLSNYPTATEPVSVNSVIMNSGSSLIAAGTFTGIITYNRTLIDDWHLIASPVVGETIENMYLKNNFIEATNSDIGLASYLYDSNTWNYYKNTTTGAITSGQGYSSKLASLGDVSFTGTMATTGISISSFGRTIDYNLVGNPYPSYINIESFLNENSNNLEEKTLWMYRYDDVELKRVYKPISLTSTLKHIAPTQGFFVQPKEESTVLNFRESMQSHQSVDTFQKTNSSERPEIKLLITNGTSTKYTDIFYIEGTTTGFDNGYDSSIFNSTASFSLYTNTITNSSGRKLAIQSLPNSDYESMVVPVGITADADKEITFSATAINLPAGIKVYLEDRELNVFTELIAVDTDVYKVDLAAAVNGVGRFYLHTSQKVLDVSDVPILTNIKIYTATNTNLRIVGLPEGAKALKLYNIIGQEIMSTSFNTNGVKDIALPNLSKGVYNVQLKIGSEIIREKIFIE